MEELEKLRLIQNSLRKYIDLKQVDVSSYKRVAGVDTAYVTIDGKEYGICCIEIFDLDSMQLLEQVTDYCVVQQEYIPGYFAFRELPVILNTLDKISIFPDIFMIDGNGYLHDNNMGIATMFSIYTNYPSIGVAKSFYRVKGATFEEVKDEVGATSAIEVNGECYGYVMRSRKGCKPIYVSPGNHIDFNSSLYLVNKCLNKDSRIPVPVRMADIETHKERKKLIKSLEMK